MADPSGPPDGSIKVTPFRALAVAALFGALAGWLVVAASNSFNFTAPQVPWTAPAMLGVLAALIGVLAYVTYARIHVRRERIEPQRAVSYLVLGKACALAGAMVAGGYLTYGLLFVTRLDASAPRARLIGSLISVVAGVGLAFAGLALERACKVPKTHDDSDSEDTDT